MSLKQSGQSLPCTVTGTSLHALTAAALALPGLSANSVHAAESSASVHFGFYEEGARQAVKGSYKGDPIRNDNLQASGSITLFDRYVVGFKYTQDTWSGATPISTAPYALMSIPSGASPAFVTNNANVLLDKKLNFYTLNAEGEVFRDPRTVHMIATASPETRRQGDFSLGYEWDEAALRVAGGISSEPDYESRFASFDFKRDFNQKMSTLNLGFSYTDSDAAAVPDPRGLTYIDKALYLNATQGPSLRREGNAFVFRGERTDWSAQLGWTQVLSKDALIETSLSYTRSSGFLENPYKVVTFLFVDPLQNPDPVDGLIRGFAQPAFENRPDDRNQWVWSLRSANYFPELSGALHTSYRLYRDDWGIDSHTFELRWAQDLGNAWMLSPMVRYYSQEAADFYRPYFLFEQAAPRTAGKLDYGRIPVKQFSSDHRLSGFGAVSAGLSLSKQFAKGAASLEASVEYYTHEGGLKFGGGGEGNYADFDSVLFNVGLRVNLSPTTGGASTTGVNQGSNDGKHAAHHMHGMRAPAGVMLDHMLSAAGDYMVGYRYMFSQNAGSVLNSTRPAADSTIVSQGCNAPGCGFTPREMAMHMHMLDLMYAPADWLNLMLMPQIMTMDMELRPLEGGVQRPSDDAHHHGPDGGDHSTGGLGDLRVYALARLFDLPGHHAHIGLGLSAPTGDIEQKMSNGTLQHYHMQLGSGTWDLLPSITYTGSAGRIRWGGQISGIKRLEEANASGFALGDQLQLTGWGGFQWNEWLTTTVRGAYTIVGSISGAYKARHDESSPPDFPSNYGGRYLDLGLGVNLTVPYGPFKGHQVSLEWLQPLEDNVNGFQLERTGSFAATWSMTF